MSELRAICTRAREIIEAAIHYIYLPKLKLPSAPAVVDGLLCVQQHSGYATRLFLSAEVPGKGSNWSSHQILGRTWYTWSWKDVSADLRPIEILSGHLRALR